MTVQVDRPPDLPLLDDGSKVGGWWHPDEGRGRIVCDLCPRQCALKDGDRGFCFVRQNRDGQVVLTTYGRSTGFCIDPIEKKPLNHFYPGTPILSFGTGGCNLGCKFCQNWTTTKSREVDLWCDSASPAAIAEAAARHQCLSVAFTYNDPVIWAEYAIDTARECHKRGIKTVAVTAGYIAPSAREPFFEFMDAANVDLKGFTEEFYQKYCLGHLQPVLDTLIWLVHRSHVWVEITNLVIPEANDSPQEIREMCRWIVRELSPDVPLHFTAFHPDFRLLDRPPTPARTLRMAYEIAREEGLRYVYTGNIHDPSTQSTYCPGCGRVVIERDGYYLGLYALNGYRCQYCGMQIAGRFGDRAGNWGARRQPIQISQRSSNRFNSRGTAQAQRAFWGRKKSETLASGSAAGSQARKEGTEQNGGEATPPQNRGNSAEPTSSEDVDESGVDPCGKPSEGYQAPLNSVQTSEPLSAKDREAHQESSRNCPNAGNQPMGHSNESSKDGGAASRGGLGGGSLRIVPDPLELSPQEEAALLRAAATRVLAALSSAQAPSARSLLGPAAERPVLGVFVSLKRGGLLRACCGAMGEPIRLAEAVDQAAYRAAKEDYRFPPISPTELADLDIEVWVLWGWEVMPERGENRVRAVEIGRHGLQVMRGQQRGLLLPGVASELGLDAQRFLEQTCLKAGLPANAWRDPETIVATFEGYSLHGRLNDLVDRLPPPGATIAGPSLQDVAKLAEFCRQNLWALYVGATPNFYSPQAFDGQMCGVALWVEGAGINGGFRECRVALRPEFPLQGTLYELTQAAARYLGSRRIAAQLVGSCQVGVAAFWDCLSHGSADNPVWSGGDAVGRALLVAYQGRWILMFDTARRAVELLPEALKQLRPRQTKYAAIFTFAVASGAQKAIFQREGATAVSPQVRPPAVAGRFYPPDLEQINRQLDRWTSAAVKPEEWAGALVPHAGWVYSGHLAFETLSAVRFPRRVIVLATKHVRAGVDWAVADYEGWSIPGGVVPGDPQLAARLAEKITGLEVDQSPHGREHAIEVLLPMIRRLAPEVRVVGIVMHGGELEELETFGREMAQALKELEELPLIIISTDLSHYVPEEKAHRLDQLVIDAIEARDPRRLFKIAREKEISMCGLVPTVAAMLTLAELGKLNECKKVAYTTSARTSGDRQNVVGYLGVLIR